MTAHRGLAALFLLMTAVGCSKPAPEFGVVSGVVKVAGKPQPQIVVQFFPDPDKGNTWPINASATTDKDGKYTLSYAWREGEGSGAPIGWHRVALEDAKLSAIGQGDRLPPVRIAPAYTNPASSPLSLEVVAGDQTHNLELPRP